MTKDEYEDFVLRYKGCGACFPMYHTLSRFEKMWFSSIQKDVAELEKENTELKDVIEGYKKIAKWCDKCDKIAELKSENRKWKDEWQEQVQKATDEGYARTLQTIQLNNAKEIIRDLINLTEPTSTEEVQHWNETFRKAEQFIKDSEVEK